MSVRVEEVKYCKFSINCKVQVKILGYHCPILFDSFLYPDFHFSASSINSVPQSIVFGIPQAPEITVCLASLEYLITGLGQTSERFNPSS